MWKGGFLGRRLRRFLGGARGGSFLRTGGNRPTRVRGAIRAFYAESEIRHARAASEGPTGPLLRCSGGARIVTDPWLVIVTGSRIVV